MKTLTKFYRCLMICCLFSCSIYLHAQFDGGYGDGTYKSSTIQITLNGNPINPIGLYRGGQGDGTNKSKFQATLSGQSLMDLYAGGIGDGHTKLFLTTSIDGIDLAQLYMGGTGDGAHKINTETTLGGDMLSQLFAGGFGDGSDKDNFTSTLDGITLDGLYAGGFGDGAQKLNLETTLNGDILSQLFAGGFGDGANKENYSGVVDGTSLEGLYTGGNGDGFSKNDIQYIFSFPSCTFVVNTDNDGFGSLRYAIDCAAPGDTIQFSPLLIQDSIGLTSGPLVVSKDLYLNSSKAAELFVNGTLISHTFQIDPAFSVSIKGLKIIVGANPVGGAVQNEGLLTLIDVDIYDPTNTATSVINSTISGVLTIRGLVQILEN